MKNKQIKIRYECDTKSVKDELHKALGAGLLTKDGYLVVSATLSPGDYVYEVINSTPQQSK
jgi:hypothetical protein